MTYKEFEQLLAEFNLHKINEGSYSGFISPEYKWGDYPLIILLDEGKLQINMEFDIEARTCYHDSRNVVVSTIESARYFISKIMNKRKRFLIQKRMDKMAYDFI